ncbi:MAG: hypothetical protein KAS04_00115 [Candidatus Aenigmarchaeota archaeon]|nr:hypothetical protein [Candidatus Aenigmarchaeota archaeon]
MNINDLCGDMLSHLREILKMEISAGENYAKLAESVNDEEIKKLFTELAKEEGHHEKTVREMVILLEGFEQKPSYDISAEDTDSDDY